MGAHAVGQIFGGRYRIVQMLGAGGMGAVYEAFDMSLGRRVALKVLHPHLALRGELVARFLREAHATARLQHPNLIAVTDAGPPALLAGQPSTEPAFLVMEYLEGRSLAQEIERAPLSPLRAANIAAQVLAALEVAHASGIVHRDIKPDNVFLTAFMRGDLVKVLDFGIAKLRDEVGQKLTATGAMVGSPAYMSPEQARGEAVDPRTDIYGVGACLYHALTGRLPFDGSSVPQMVVSILRDTPPPVSSVRKDVPEGLSAIVFRAMAKERDARYVDAREMRSALERFMAGADVGAIGETVSADALPRLSPLVSSSAGVPTLDAPPSYVASASAPPAERTMPEAARAPARNDKLVIVGMVCVTAIVLAALAFSAMKKDKEVAERPSSSALVLSTHEGLASNAPLAPATASVSPRATSPSATALAGMGAGTPSGTSLGKVTATAMAKASSSPSAEDARGPLQPLAGGQGGPPSKKPTGSVKPRLTFIDANGSYDLDLIRAVLASALPRVTECYAKAEYDAVDHMFVNYLIRTERATGRVTGVGGVGSSERSPFLDQCVSAALRTLTFGPMPKPNKGYEHDAGDIKVGYNAEIF